MKQPLQNVLSTIEVVVELPRTPRPGDRLLVVNGVCVGFEATPGRPRTPRAQAHGIAPLTKTGNRHNPEEDEKILAYLRENGPTDAGRLMDGLGIDPKDERRMRVNARISRLRHRGLIRPVKADKNKAKPRYEEAPR